MVTYKIIDRFGDELASVEHGDMLRTVRRVIKYQDSYYQTEHEEEGITGEKYDGQIIAQSPTLEDLRKLGDPNVIDGLVAAIEG